MYFSQGKEVHPKYIYIPLCSLVDLYMDSLVDLYMDSEQSLSPKTIGTNELVKSALKTIHMLAYNSNYIEKRLHIKTQ